jgi:hypothetical protein
MNNLLNGEVKMISESEVRKELAVLKLTVPNSCRAIIELAESWLGRKMVEKIDLPYTAMGAPEEMWNAAIDACRLASVVSEDTKKALAIQEAIRKVEVGAEVIIHNTDGSIYCILKKTAEEEER